MVRRRRAGRGPARAEDEVTFRFSGRFIEGRRTLEDGGRAEEWEDSPVDMSLQLADELKRHRIEHNCQAPAKGWGAQPLFLSSEGAAQANFVRQVFNPLLRKAGLRRVRPHALRHRFVVNSLRRLAPRAGLEPATSGLTVEGR
jgi:integrase